MSVDTNVKGRDTAPYHKIVHDDITLLVAKPLMLRAWRIELVTRKKLLGNKLAAVAHNHQTAAGPS
ncbi:MAG: hypothetical protein AAF547_04715 [Actinomycetota bacterium]